MSTSPSVRVSDSVQADNLFAYREALSEMPEEFQAVMNAWRDRLAASFRDVSGETALRRADCVLAILVWEGYLW